MITEVPDLNGENMVAFNGFTESFKSFKSFCSESVPKTQSHCYRDTYEVGESLEACFHIRSRTVRFSLQAVFLARLIYSEISVILHSHTTRPTCIFLVWTGTGLINPASLSVLVRIELFLDILPVLLDKHFLLRHC